jgi:hypothetical protein
VLTVAVTLLIGLGPGAALGYGVPGGPARWAVWASAPVLTMGLASVGLAWLNALGLPSGAGMVLGVEIAVVLIAVALGRWCERRSDGSRRERRPPLLHSVRTRWVDLVALAVPAALFLVVAEGMLGGFRYPPGWDGENHGYLTRAILDTGSTDVARVCTDGTSGAPASCHFYPLAMDVTWAQTVAVSHGLVSTSMLTWAIVIAPLGLLVALYAAVRMLGGSAILAGCVALGPAVLGPLWVGVMAGRVPEEAAPGFSVAVGVLAALAVRGRYPVRMGLLAGLGMAGILISHTYDVLFAATVAVALTCAGPLVARAQARHGTRNGNGNGTGTGTGPGNVAGTDGLSRRPILLAIGSAALAGLLTVGPYGSSLLGADGERASTRPQDLGDLGGAWHFWVTDVRRYSTFGFPAPGDHATWPDLTLVHLATGIAVVALLVAPLALVIPRLRWARPWLGLFVFWTAVGIWTSYSDDPVASYLAGLWYGGAERLRVMVLPIYATVTVTGICVMALGLQWVVVRVLARAQAAPGWTRTVAPAAAAVVVLGLVGVGVHAHRDPALPLRQDLSERTPITSSYPRVFRWLAAHTTAGQVVAADRNVEFMVWSYADHGTGLLFGIPPLIAASKPNAAARDAVWDWLVANPNATPSGCDVTRFNVAYLVVGTKRMPGYASKYDPARIAASPNLALTLRDGDVTVYAVTDAARAC